jgi:hypothetical protein
VEIPIEHYSATGIYGARPKLAAARTAKRSSANIPGRDQLNRVPSHHGQSHNMQSHNPEMQGEHHAKFRRGLEQFNAGQFFDAHESWEEIWLSSAEPDKSFLQGIIQIAAAFHHYTYGNMRGARSLLEAGLRRVAPFPPRYQGIHLETLREAARNWAADLAAGRDPGTEQVPQIHLSAKD